MRAVLLVVVLLLGLLPVGVFAQALTPIGMTGWNADIIAERTAGSPAAGTTTSIIPPGGTGGGWPSNVGWCFYEFGAPNSTQGLPNSGLFTSQANPDVTFAFQPYGGKNVVLDGGRLNLTAPAAYTKLALLTAAQSAAGVDFEVSVNFAGGTSTVYTIHDDDWTSPPGSNAALLNVGLVHDTSSWTGFYSNSLSLWEHDITLSDDDKTKTITSVNFVMESGGHEMIFGISGVETLPGMVVHIDAVTFGDPTSGFPTLQVPLPAGSWRLTEVDPATDNRAIYTAWSAIASRAAWLNTLDVYEGAPGTLVHVARLGTGTGWPNANSAFLDPLNVPIVVTLSAPGYLNFGVDDNLLKDNTGGISVRIERVPTTASLSISPKQVFSGVSSVGTIVLSGPAPAGGLVIVLSSDSSFASVPATVTVPAGQTSVTFTITTVGVATNTIATISATYNAEAHSAKLTILAPVLAAFSVSPASVAGGGSVGGTVTLSGVAPVGGITVGLSSSLGCASVQSIVLIPEGSRAARVTVSTIAVSTDQVSAITASLNGVLKPSNLTVKAPVIVGIVISPSKVLGGLNATGTVTLGSVAPAGGLTVALSSNASQAMVPPSVLVPAGATTATFIVTTVGVPTDLWVTITASVNASSKQVAFTVAAPKWVSISVSPAAIVGGGFATGTVTVATPAPTGGMSVTLTSSDPSVTVQGSVTILGGTLSAKFPVTTVPVAVDTVVSVTGNVGSLAGLSANVTVKAPVVAAVSVSPSSVFGGASATGTVSLESAAPSAGLEVLLNSSTASATVPASVHIAPGATKATFAVSTVAVSTDDLLSISATAGSSSKSTSLTVKAPLLAAFSVSPAKVHGGGSVNATITLGSVAPAGGLDVSVTVDLTDAVSVPVTVTIPGGAISVRFVVGTSIVASDRTATVSASLNGATKGSALTVLAPLLAAFSVSPVSVVGGGSVGATVTLGSAAPVGGMDVSISYDSGSASGPVTVNVPAGTISVRFTISTLVVSSDTVVTVSAKLAAVTKSSKLTVRAGH